MIDAMEDDDTVKVLSEYKISNCEEKLTPFEKAYFINEYGIEDYNEKVFNIFQKYNQNTYKVSYVDCSSIVISNYFNIDVVLSLDNGFKLFNEIDLFKLS